MLHARSEIAESGGFISAALPDIAQLLSKVVILVYIPVSRAHKIQQLHNRANTGSVNWVGVLFCFVVLMTREIEHLFTVMTSRDSYSNLPVPLPDLSFLLLSLFSCC